jgi:cation:H+ antiporter
VNPLAESIETLGLAGPWTYLALFLAASLLMIWRFEALLRHGLEGTAVGTLIMPYCSGLGNLLFVAIVASRGEAPSAILTNCLVNNVTNLTVLLGLPALCFGLTLLPGSTQKSARRKSSGPDRAAAADTARSLTRLSLLLSLTAGLFFAGITWILAEDGRLDARDGLVLVGLFLFWQAFQVFDILKNNVTQRRAFSPLFYLDIAVLLAGAYVVYVSLDWIVAWLSAQKDLPFGAQSLGWLSGLLMVLPNALLAFFYAARRRADIVYASQIGDGHICIPLCLGLGALVQPLPVPPAFSLGLGILVGAIVVHATALAFHRGLPRWAGWPLLAAYAWFLGSGLFA